MEDAERATPSKSRTSNAIRVERHRLRTQARVQLLGLLLKDPTVQALANALANADAELANALANDPFLLANALANEATPLANAPSLELAGALANGRVAPAPSPPAPSRPLSPSDSLSPPRNPTPLALTPTGGTLAEPASAGRRNENFERLADGFYPGIKGDYSKLDSDSRGLLNRSLARLNAKMDEQGVPAEKRPDLISYGINNLPNVARGTTPSNLVKHWMQAIAGADRNGRDNGLVHTRYLNETATKKHQSRMGLE